jgi:anti-sigma factor RsiW
MRDDLVQFNEWDCPSPEIAAYIDGELSGDRELALELHIADCDSCSAELNSQKLFLCTLDASLKAEPEITLPANFTRTIVARAEGSVAGLRKPVERFQAAFICAALFMFGLFALGADAAGSFGWLSAVIEKAAAVAGFLLHIGYSIMIGFSILTRSLSGLAHLPAALSLFSVVLFAMLFVSLSRRLIRVRRT